MQTERPDAGPGQLTPGIPAVEYAARRANLARMMGPGDMAILPAAPQQARLLRAAARSASRSYPRDSPPPLQFVSGIIPIPYRQDADFRYLTGVTQQGVAVLQSTGGFEDPGHRRGSASVVGGGGLAARGDVFRALWTQCRAQVPAFCP